MADGQNLDAFIDNNSEGNVQGIGVNAVQNQQNTQNIIINDFHDTQSSKRVSSF